MGKRFSAYRTNGPTGRIARGMAGNSAAGGRSRSGSRGDREGTARKTDRGPLNSRMSFRRVRGKSPSASGNRRGSETTSEPVAKSSRELFRDSLHHRRMNTDAATRNLPTCTWQEPSFACQGLPGGRRVLSRPGRDSLDYPTSGSLFTSPKFTPNAALVWVALT